MLTIYNTLSAKKEVFRPVNKDQVGMYVCGPTVYDLGHLGHGRSAVSFDVIRKYLIFKGYKVKYVSNYTDIDDKLIQRAEQKKITVAELAAQIMPEYDKDYAALGMMKPDVQPRATEYVDQMIEIIMELDKNGFAYVLNDGVYFDVSKFKDYGKLSKQKLDKLIAGSRVAIKEGKRSQQDFVLWKFSKPGEPTWKSPWGDGRPGWHIECSAMSKQNLGVTFDIHGGGADLVFPHHECEIAQSEAANNALFAKYWLHNGFIRIDNEKMSKSLGNFFTLRDIFAKYDPQAVRLLFLQTHYRSPIDFTHEILEQAKNTLTRLHDFARKIRNYKTAEENNEQDKYISELLDKTRQAFEERMDDDFDTSGGMAAWFESMKILNKLLDDKRVSVDEQKQIIALMQNLDFVFGVFEPAKVATVDQNILDLIERRNAARKAKDWKTSDQIRDELLKMGIQLEDSADGTIWKKV